MKNRVNDKIKKVYDEVKDVETEDIKDVEEEVSEEPVEKVTVELTQDKYDKLMAMLDAESETEAVEVVKESKVKKVLNIFKPTKKKFAVVGGVAAALLGGVAMGKLAKGNNEEAPVNYPELPENDDYNPPREDYVETRTTEDSTIEVDEEF